MGGPMSVMPVTPPPSEPAPAPPPSLIETIGLEYRRSGVAPDWGRNQVDYESKLQQQIRQALQQRGYQADDYILGYAREERARRAAQGSAYLPNPVMSRALAAEDAMYRDLAAERARDQHFLAELGDVRDPATLAAGARQRRAEETRRYDAQLEGSPFLGRVVGGLGYGLTDPVNLLPIGGPEAGVAISGARRIGTAMWQGTKTNVAITALTEPFVHGDAEAMGIRHGPAEVVSDLGSAGLAGLLLGGGHAVVGEALGALHARWRAAGTEGDRLIVAAMEQTLPRANWTPDEQAAAHVLTRTSDIAESSPFEPGGPGDTAHAARLDGAYRSIAGADAPPSPNVPRVTQPVTAGVLARDQVKARIRAAESSGDDRAVNPSSTASGRFQFTRPTWLSYYKRRYGGGTTGAERDAIWAKRFDPNLQEVLYDDLSADNGRMLRAAGHPETATNLYLLHLVGPDGLKVLRAEPHAPLAELLPARDLRENKFMQGKTAADLIAYADRKMGGRGEVRTASAAAPREAGAEPVAEEPWPDMPQEPRDFAAAPDGLLDPDRPNLRAALFGTPEEHAAAQLAVWREMAPPAAGESAGAPAPAAAGETTVFDLRAPERAPMRRSGPVDVMQAIADAGGLRDDEGHDLVKGRGVPKFIRGAGVIVREGGRSIDAIGEHLWEQGYFGPHATAKRPREAEVLDLIERALRGRVFKPEDAAAMAQRAAERRAQPEGEARWELEQHAAEHGLRLDPRTLDDALMHRADGETVEGAVARAVHEAAYRDAEPPAGLDRFEDPDGEGVQAQIDSLDHDLRMAAEAGDEGGYRLEEEGAVVSIADLIEELDEDLRAAETLRTCMAPTAVAAE